MAIVMGLDQHRAQITAEWIDTETGELSRCRISPAHRAGVRRFCERFGGTELEVDQIARLALLVNACTSHAGPATPQPESSSAAHRNVGAVPDCLAARRSSHAPPRAMSHGLTRDLRRRWTVDDDTHVTNDEEQRPYAHCRS